VVFESEIIPEWNNWKGTFTATGAAVDEGVMCPEGELDLGQFDQGVPTWRVEVVHICADGSGKYWITYDLKAENTDEGPTESGVWLVSYGTDAYETLIGNGVNATTSPEAGIYVSMMEGQLAMADG
jgi:hypothetical protein